MWTHSGWEDCDAVCGGGKKKTPTMQTFNAYVYTACIYIYLPCIYIHTQTRTNGILIFQTLVVSVVRLIVMCPL